MPDLPLDLGETSAVEPGPWHYGADYVTVYFRAEKEALQSLLPNPYEVADGTCIAYVCEIVSVSEANPRLASDDPSRTNYGEIAFGIKCTFAGRPGVFFPVMWVDTEWSLLRGLVNGYSKRLADNITMTRLHPLNPGLKPLGVGAELSGYGVKGGKTVIRVDVRIEKSAEPADLVSFGATYGVRRFPASDRSQGQISESVEILKSNSRLSDVWTGKGSLRVDFDLGGVVPLFGAAYRSGFTISGSRVLAKT